MLLLAGRLAQGRRHLVEDPAKDDKSPNRTYDMCTAVRFGRTPNRKLDDRRQEGDMRKDQTQEDYSERLVVRRHWVGRRLG